MNRVVVLTTLLLVGLIVPTSIYALQSNVAPLTEPKEIALNYIRNSPTFSFDGIDATLEAVNMVDLKSNPVQHLVTVNFSCLHSGYGDRTGKPTLQVITPHKAVVTVVDGIITKAVYDDSWDELDQKLLPQTSDDVTKIALAWLQNSATYKFDGVARSLKVVEVWQAQTFAYPSFWQVTIEFCTLHAGYGDRTGQVLAQVITHHSIRIHVTEGMVTMAIIDEKWDELKQSMLPSNLGAVTTPESARDCAVAYLIKAYRLPYATPVSWILEELTPNGTVGSVSFRFTSGPWSVTVKYPVVLKPNYTVLIGYDGSAPFTWKGYVGSDGMVTVEDTSLEQPANPQLIHGPIEARDLCVEYVLSNHPCIQAKPPAEWSVRNLIPEGIVGATKLEYSAGGWMVVVSGSVVWKPTYSIELRFTGLGGFRWSGTLCQGGPVQELEFSS